MDNGMISSQGGKEASAQNAFLIFTSNLGAAEMEKRNIGFGAGTKDDAGKEAVHQWFAPEFRNRLDGVIMFNRLSKDNMSKILDKFISQLNTLTERKGVSVVFDAESKQWLMDQGFDRNMGARPLARVINEQVKKPLSREMLFGRLKNGGAVMFKMNEGKLSFDVIDTGIGPDDIEIDNNMEGISA
jgi:ATP-dependent Clp protease ATP-binding subunit ClpA